MTLQGNGIVDTKYESLRADYEKGHIMNAEFVDWTKEKQYHLSAWSGWQPGLYTWQIGIVKGYKTEDTKQFIADTGRDSQPFLIKWQAAGSGGGSTGGGGGGGAPSGGRSSGS